MHDLLALIAFLPPTIAVIAAICFSGQLLPGYEKPSTPNRDRMNQQ